MKQVIGTNKNLQDPIHDKDIQLQFGFCVIQMRQKNLKVVFADYLAKEVSGS